MTTIEDRNVIIFPNSPPTPSFPEPSLLRLNWDHSGTISFTIQEVQPNVLFDVERGGVHFLDPNAPYIQTSPSPGSTEPTGLYTFTYDNTNAALTGIAFHYQVSLTNGFSSTTTDPTVENESPPPPND
jgi:hypothetical protein